MNIRSRIGENAEAARPRRNRDDRAAVGRWAFWASALVLLTLTTGCFGLTGMVMQAPSPDKQAVAANANDQDDTDAIQAMIDAVPDAGGEVRLPPGTYRIDAVRSVRLKSNVSLIMDQGAVLQAVPNSSPSYAVLRIDAVENVRVVGGAIRGERDSHSGTEGEWGMGIRVTGARNVLIQGTRADACWGDGFYIGADDRGNPAEDIRLTDVQADRNRRQGISLTSGVGIRILRPRLTHTGGTEPSSGLDIEPNRVTDRMEDIEIIEPFTSRNAAGISLSLKKMGGTKRPVSVVIRNHRDEGSGRGMLISSADSIVPGEVRVEDAVWIGSQQNGLAVQNHDHRSFHIDILRPRVENANRSGSASAATGTAIAIYHFTGRTGIIGNITIQSPRILDTADHPLTRAAFFVSNGMGQEIRNLSILDPEISGNIASGISAGSWRD